MIKGLNDFSKLALKNTFILYGGFTKTDGGTYNRGGHCFTYTSDCSFTDGDLTTINYCGIGPCPQT